jgi:hypothetical protein
MYVLYIVLTIIDVKLLNKSRRRKYLILRLFVFLPSIFMHFGWNSSCKYFNLISLKTWAICCHRRLDIMLHSWRIEAVMDISHALWAYRSVNSCRSCLLLKSMFDYCSFFWYWKCVPGILILLSTTIDESINITQYKTHLLPSKHRVSKAYHHNRR